MMDLLLFRSNYGTEGWDPLDIVYNDCFDISDPSSDISDVRSRIDVDCHDEQTEEILEIVRVSIVMTEESWEQNRI